jgi:hypothetical protein
MQHIAQNVERAARDRRLMAAIRSAAVYIRVSLQEAVATRSNAIFNASARLNRPATYPQLLDRATMPG